MSIAELLIISAALSLDAVGIGASCRIKGVSMPFSSKIMVTFVSFVFTEAAVIAGGMIGNAVSAHYAKIAGAAVLFILGSYIIISEVFKKKGGAESQIFPSDKIDLKGALCIGAAVSGDSVAVGISLGGDLQYFAVGCAVFQLLCLCIGDCIAMILKEKTRISNKRLTIVSGLVIIATGVTRIL